MDKKGYYYIQQIEPEEVINGKDWGVFANEYYDGYPLVSSWSEKLAAEHAADTLNEILKAGIVAALQQELAIGLMQEPSAFHLTFYAYDDPTYSVTFENAVGTEFFFVNVYVNEKTMEITQRNTEMRLVSDVGDDQALKQKNIEL